MLSNHVGGISNSLMEIIKKTIRTKYLQKILIATYSPTLKNESLKNYEEEIIYS